MAWLDGHIADEHDGVGCLHDWCLTGEHPLADEDERPALHGARFRVSAASAEYVRGMWSRQTVVAIGRHRFDLTNGWDGHPSTSDHVVVSRRPRPTGCHREASYPFASSVTVALERAQALAGEAQGRSNCGFVKDLARPLHVQLPGSSS
ncbi:MAG TPA: hypothetical protein VFN55_11855 [Solirubrobacteraceae bacterium]|nr:hypothetical protein [Solirubrobacteraceae bacterium]